MVKLGIIGSGNGSNFQAILEAINHGRLKAQIACVLSDNSNAHILFRAKTYGIPAIYIDCSPFRTKLDGRGEEEVIRIMQEYDVHYIILAGFMRMIKTGLLSAFPRKIINIHPSLLPAFPGLASWKQALEYGVKWTGCTVHFVDSGMDTGPIIIQRVVPVMDADTPDTLHARIQQQEHIAYPEALDLLLSGKAILDGRLVRIAATSKSSVSKC